MPTINDDQVRALLDAAAATRADELDCEQFLAEMAAYAEACVEGRPIGAELARAAEHETLCHACRHELHALIEILQTEAP